MILSESTFLLVWERFLQIPNNFGWTLPSTCALLVVFPFTTTTNNHQQPPILRIRQMRWTNLWQNIQLWQKMFESSTIPPCWHSHQTWMCGSNTCIAFFRLNDSVGLDTSFCCHNWTPTGNLQSQNGTQLRIQLETGCIWRMMMDVPSRLPPSWKLHQQLPRPLQEVAWLKLEKKQADKKQTTWTWAKWEPQHMSTGPLKIYFKLSCNLPLSMLLLILESALFLRFSLMHPVPFVYNRAVELQTTFNSQFLIAIHTDRFTNIHKKRHSRLQCPLETLLISLIRVTNHHHLPNPRHHHQC